MWPRRDSLDPSPGWYRLRLVRGGPQVPARIWRPCFCTVNSSEVTSPPVDPHAWSGTCDRFPMLAAEIDGVEKDSWGAEKIMAYGEPIDEAEFNYMTDTRRWAAAHEPDHPMADPTRKIDLHTAPPVF